MRSRSEVRRSPFYVALDGPTVRIGKRKAFVPDALVAPLPEPAPDSLEITDPIIVVEVLSPSTAQIDATKKLSGYFEVPSMQHYLIVDPEGRAITHHRRSAGDVLETRIVSEGTLRLDPPGIDLDIGAVFPSGAAGNLADRGSTWPTRKSLSSSAPATPLAARSRAASRARASSACVTRRDADKLAPLVERIQREGGEAHGFGSDARKEEEMVALFETIEREIGPIEVAVFNIGAQRALSDPRDDGARLLQGLGDGLLRRLPDGPRGGQGHGPARPRHDHLHRRHRQPARR